MKYENGVPVPSLIKAPGIPQRIKYMGIGAILAMGAPLGWFAMSLVLDFKGPYHGIYLYLTLSTLIVFMIFGYLLGIKQDLLGDLVDRDLLTGLFNQTAFFRMSEILMELAKRQHAPISIVMMDIDNFKTEEIMALICAES